MMELISVESATATAVSGIIDLMLTADLGQGAEAIPFTYVPGDPYGLGPLVGAWLTANPGFAIGSYVPPTPSTNPADYDLTMRQLRIGLKVLGGKPASFLQDTISAIADADQRDLAQIWYEETTLVSWDHPMTQNLIALSGIPLEQAAAMWLAAPGLDA